MIVLARITKSVKVLLYIDRSHLFWRTCLYLYEASYCSDLLLTSWTVPEVLEYIKVKLNLSSGTIV